MNTTTEILSVDGVVLNTLAKNIETLAGRLHVPGKRTPNQVLPGKHGSLSVGGKMFEDNVIVLPMWIRGCDNDGAIPSGSRRVEFYKNLDALTRLFMRDGLRDVRHTLPDGTIRQCFGEVLSAIDFTTIGINPLGKYSVELDVPDVFWQDVNAINTLDVAPPSGVARHHALLAGGTAPICDAQIYLTGPANAGLVLTDSTSGEWLSLDEAVPAGQQLAIDNAAWTVQLNGVDAIGHTSHSADYLLPLTINAAGEIWLTLTAGGMTGATATGITARRKFLVG